MVTGDKLSLGSKDGLSWGLGDKWLRGPKNSWS
jgi:hypothetical protein